MFHYVNEYELLEKRTNCFITIDPAVKEKDSADYTGTIINRIDEENNWYIKANKQRINSAKLIDWIFELWTKEKPESIGIEETTYLDAVYPFIRLEMIKRNIFPVIISLKHHGTNKELRIRGLIPRYEAGKIFHVKGQCDSLEDEMLRFPKGINDDAVDALAYQEQIAQPPIKLKTEYQQAIEEMQLDSRTGYLK
jgi:phage terminase large subunit-like protein